MQFPFNEFYKILFNIVDPFRGNVKAYGCVIYLNYSWFQGILLYVKDKFVFVPGKKQNSHK